MPLEFLPAAAYDHIPRTGGKTRRVRPWSDRDQVMAEPCVLAAALEPAD